MNICIIGYGKMGREIFSLFFRKEFKNKITVICRKNHDTVKNEIVKNISKQLKRKIINITEAEIMKNSFIVTDDISCISECDLIIETISENLSAKQEVVSEAEKYISDNCIVTTNTSSFLIDDVFKKMKNKKRCCGFHFFYPVKLSEFIEINKSDFTDNKTIEFLINSADMLGKESIIFSGESTDYFNQLSATYIFHAFYAEKILNFRRENAENAMSENNALYSPFTLAESIGSELILTGQKNFRIKHMKEFTEHSFDIYEQSLKNQFITEKITKEYSSEELYIQLTAPILNELVKDIETGIGSPEKIMKFSADILGITDLFSDIYTKYGYEKINTVLMQYFNKNKCEFYKPADKFLYDKYYI